MQHPDSNAANEAWQSWLAAEFDQPTALAAWTRTRALLLWQAQPSVAESDRLMLESLLVEQVNHLSPVQFEAAARIDAASPHPLDFDGKFREGFHAAIEKARVQRLPTKFLN
jgi:hypothetical protein